MEWPDIDPVCLHSPTIRPPAMDVALRGWAFDTYFLIPFQPVYQTRPLIEDALVREIQDAIRRIFVL